jgi:hypothetical protein
MSHTFRTNCPVRNFIVPLKDRNINNTIPASEVSANVVSTQQKIWNTVRVPASEYTMNRAALNVYTAPRLSTGVNWNQYSDRAVAGVVRSNVPTYGSSTHQSITRMRPGSTSAPGAGVDVKHGSYDRYLARLKGRSALRTQSSAKAAATPVAGNKTQSYGIAYHNSCLC